MTENKKKVEVDIGLDDMLMGVGNLIDVITKLQNESKSTAINLKDIKDLNEKSKGFFGVSVNIGTGAISTVKDVIGKLPGKPDKRVREPIVDVFEEKDYIEVIAELPGLEEKDIKYEIKEQKASGHPGLNAMGRDLLFALTIYSDPPEADKRKYRKEMPLSFPVSANDIQSIYKNGILKLRLKKLS